MPVVLERKFVTACLGMNAVQEMITVAELTAIPMVILVKSVAI